MKHFIKYLHVKKKYPNYLYFIYFFPVVDKIIETNVRNNNNLAV